MEHARLLIRTIVRAFYQTEHVVVIDALDIHKALTLSDLALIVDNTKNTKPLGRTLGLLRTAGLISVYARSETRPNALKPTTREYFYIDYRRAVDSVKFRLYQLDLAIKALAKPGGAEKKEFWCRRCGAEYSALEAHDLIDFETGSFRCARCQFELDEREEDGGVKGGEDDAVAAFNKQVAGLLKILQRVDESVVPVVTGEMAVANMVPLPRDESLNPTVQMEVFDPARAVRPTAVKGMATGPEKFDLAITTDAEITAQELAAKAEKKARIATQNLLPSWHTNSTITGEAVVGAVKVDEDGATPLRGEDADDEDKKGGEGDAYLEDYYRQMREEEQAIKAAEEEAEEEDEEDEDEFEDVIPGGLNGVTNGSPAGLPAADEPDAKKAKVEIEKPAVLADREAAASVPGLSAPAPAPTPTAEESDEDEFEDAL
ncbi:hypothetical protein W97_03714 [Coniosporium apollinis CBS 100218]|uniref:HTH TFE/IIEalpha-type domain-containing protein n=1 Tax=Coniosporium apollinis (strain CBS 100218) TaxID=1168221 RepID=R7YRE5_CONA1|nr:uncharacterized protein W97_03714 [Coniosporium apollinis CBS 100218]EON64482.1 hypothetical protein W97_03714 [Coniosporium apollinis CBS 100218]